MAKLFVRSFPAQGYNGLMRAGHHWPGTGIEVETVDQDKDPPQEAGGPRRIGKVTLAALEAEPMIAVAPGGGVGSAVQKDAEIARLRERVAELEAQLGEADQPAAPKKHGK